MRHEKRVRNRELYRMRIEGLTYRQLAGHYGISKERARELCHWEEILLERRLERTARTLELVLSMWKQYGTLDK